MPEKYVPYYLEKDELIIREYGRNFHQLILHTNAIEDSEKRQAYIERVIDLMQQMHPQSRNPEDSRIKLWQHAFYIADYKLNVNPPQGVITSKEELLKKPDHIFYPDGEPRFRHYGYNIQKMIKCASEMEEGVIKKGYTKVLASYMKLAYKTWNRDNFVSDETIKKDIERISQGKIKLADEMVIEQTVAVPLNNPINNNRGNNNSHRNNNSKGSFSVNTRNNNNNRYNNNNNNGRDRKKMR